MCYFVYSENNVRVRHSVSCQLYLSFIKFSFNQYMDWRLVWSPDVSNLSVYRPTYLRCR